MREVLAVIFANTQLYYFLTMHVIMYLPCLAFEVKAAPVSPADSKTSLLLSEEERLLFLFPLAIYKARVVYQWCMCGISAFTELVWYISGMCGL